MENQPLSPENQTSQTPIEQPVVEPVQPPTPVMPASNIQKSKRSKKGLMLLIVGLIILLLGGAAAYALLVYLPNRPEVVLKKAVTTFTQSTGNYTVSGGLDQGDVNGIDYTFAVKTNAQGGAASELNMSTTIQKPSIYARNINGKIYVNFSNFEDSKKLATHYSNSSGQKGLQEYIAEFTDISGLSTNQDKWFELGSYVTAQPEATTSSQSADLSGATLKSVGATETINGKQARKYDVELSADALKQLVGHVEKSAGVPILSGIFPGNLNTDSITAQVWVNLKTKTIEEVNYEGRPFKDATLSIKLVASENTQGDTPSSEKLTSVLNYGFVSRNVFSKQFQQGGSEADRERIADLKGIKTALEIYKAKNGHYPDRYEMSVTQDTLIGNQMKGADFEVFKDPNGKLIGRNGSQYAYVPTFKDDTESCGGVSSPACEKFFIVTTLDNGKEFQLNSD